MTKLAKIIHVCVSTLAVLIACGGTAQAQPVFDAAARRTVVAGTAEALRSRYVFPDVGERAAAAIESALAAGKYDGIADASAFAQRLTDDLRAVANDKHLRVSAFGPPTPAPGAGAPQAPPPNEAGVGRADRLADNVGYLEIVAFPALEAFQAPFDRAMAALKDTRALIIDARRHGGGTPTSETYLASYLLEAGRRVEVNRFVWRNPGTDTFRTENFWSSPTPFSYAGKPVYVLTSSFTFSGGEALAYDLRALGLARVVGETTGGGAHPGGNVPVGAGFAMFVPAGRGENPTTLTNWEGVGVSPDIAVPAADALKIALEQLGVSPKGADVDALSEARLFEPRPPQQLAGGPPQGPAPTGLVVGSGNFYSPIVADLDKAIAFYRDGIGLEMQGEPGNADENPQLRAMFGLPDARLRWQIGRAPPTPGGVEIVEISRAGGQPAELKMQDPGAVMLMVVVRDINAPLARLKQLGAPVVTTGGAPVVVGGGPQGVLAVVVKDPAGHFVQLVQLGAMPPGPAGAPNIIGVRVRHTVENLERSLALYRDALGLRAGPQVPPYIGDPTVLDLLGLPHDVQYRFTMLTVPTSGLGIELIEFQGAQRRAEPADIADPGSTRIQLRVADIDTAAAAVTKAGGTFVSTGGKPLDLPAGNATLKVGIVRDPDDLFLVLIQAP